MCLGEAMVYLTKYPLLIYNILEALDNLPVDLTDITFFERQKELEYWLNKTVSRIKNYQHLGKDECFIQIVDQSISKLIIKLNLFAHEFAIHDTNALKSIYNLIQYRDTFVVLHR